MEYDLPILDESLDQEAERYEYNRLAHNSAVISAEMWAERKTDDQLKEAIALLLPLIENGAPEAWKYDLERQVYEATLAKRERAKQKAKEKAEREEQWRREAEAQAEQRERDAKAQAKAEAKAKRDKETAAEKAQREADAAREPFTSAIGKPLPVGRVLLSFEFELDDAVWNVFDKIGFAGGDRFTIIAPTELADEYFRQGDRYTLHRFKLAGMGDVEGERLDTLAPFSKQCRSEMVLKGISEVEYRGSADGFERWLAAVTATEDELARLALYVDVCNGNASAVLAALTELTDADAVPPVSFLIPSFMANSALGLLLAAKSVGKSSMLLELAVAVAMGETECFGFPLNKTKGFAVYCHGEDSREIVKEHVLKMTGGILPTLLRLVSADDVKDMEGLRERFKGVEVSFLGVDPLRVFLKGGDEDNGNDVDAFYGPIEAFAAEHECPALVAAHLRKGPDPRSILAVFDAFRGSQVIIDRPRTIYCAYRNGSDTFLGIPSKNGSPKHAFGAVGMFEGVRVLHRWPERHRHVVSENDQGDVEALVLDAVRALHAAGARVTRTGKLDGLYTHKLPELDGLTRNAVEDAAKALIEAAKDGSLVPGPSGNGIGNEPEA
jgi:hypothetical protein